MLQRLLESGTGPERTARATLVAIITAALAALWLVPSATAVPGSAASNAAVPAADAQQQQVLTWTGDDSTTEYASFPTTATAGPATIVFENSTATGNTTGMPHTLTFDTSNPDYNQDVDLDIFASPSDANGGRHEVEVVLTPGEYRYFCDIPGHGLMTGVLVVTDGNGDDTTPPEVSAEVSGDQDADGNYVGSATVTLNATDDGSGVATTEYNLDDAGFTDYTEPIEVTEPGEHTVEYRATDNAGNTSEVGTVIFTVAEGDPGDTTPPEVSAEVSGDQDADGNYVGSATVTLNATDDGSGVATTEYDLNGAGFTGYTEPVAIDEPGDHMIHYRATDNAGNTSEVGMVHLTVVESDPDDTTPPEVSADITGDQDADGNYVGSATVTLNATDDGSGVATTEYNLDDAGFTDYTEPIDITEPGEHVIEYRATDNAGNTSDISSTIFTVVGLDNDECPDSDTRETVIIGTIDTTVTNVDTGNGCTISDLIDQDGDYANHGAFVKHVKEVANALVKDGILGNSQQSRIKSAAARSDIGKPHSATGTDAA